MRPLSVPYLELSGRPPPRPGPFSENKTRQRPKPVFISPRKIISEDHAKYHVSASVEPAGEEPRFGISPRYK
ncbi:hypothetical protein GWI33_010548 [Rhynchophorus ferrugineus]|uniref:Uncharacterized protein n=1 Tax=Rhynchophorus ferrugineus TaxID=354439 RepID=A0A834J1V6_RHYFE|nr:hypothetical protein GWI33_010548 [Rhynchophorus ferrugineus]